MDFEWLFGSDILEFMKSVENSDDEETDSLLLAASESYERKPTACRPEAIRTPPHPTLLPYPVDPGPAPSNPVPVPHTSPTHSGAKSRFAPPKTDEEIERARERAVPAKTVADTKYCVRLFDTWREHRMETTTADIPTLADMTKHQMQYWMERFVLEVQKKCGEVYPPNSLHHIVVGIMRHVRGTGQPSIDFFKDPEFADFRGSLDAEMKRLQQLGIGSTKQQAETLTDTEEDSLWEKGLLGDHTPQTLLDTIIFYNGYYFALRSGKEHRQLRRNPCQIQVVEHPGERAFLRYTEDVSKNRPGGLKGRNIKPKVVVQHANLEDSKRCFVRLFKLYMSLCPDNAPDHALYLRPANHPTANCWYSKQPLGHTTLSKTVARLCTSAGIQGHKTNHSLRATTTSRLYHSGVDEQLVMERTGHRSLEGVRSYKRTSEAQREALSDILNRPKRPRTNNAELALQPPHPVTPTQYISAETQSHHLLHGLSLPSATFNNCNINFYIGSAASGSTGYLTE